MDKKGIRRAALTLSVLASLVPWGCAVAARDKASSADLNRPGDHVRHLAFGGRDRFAEIHVPPQYSKGSPTPVILLWHGGGGYPGAMRKQSGMDAVSDRHGFLAVYPAGSGTRTNRLLTFNAGACCDYAVKENIDDVGFTAALIDDLASVYSIDRARVYSTGLSNGALLSYRLACELSDRIAAIAPVAGTLGIERCAPKRAVSVMAFHGLADNNLPFAGGVGKRSVSKVNFRPVSETIQTWVRLDGCPETPKPSSKGAATARVYGPCRDGAEVVLWAIEGGGHTWPGGETTLLEKAIVGPVNRDISASEEMWAFFKRHAIR
jgi:polyhydroxybutyrate depolymerase